MIFRSNSLASWGPIPANLIEWQRIASQLRALHSWLNYEKNSGIRYGESLWGAPSKGSLVAIAWRWREVQKNIVAIENPMEIDSNVVLIDDLGNELMKNNRIMYLNNAVYALRWQTPVLFRSRSNNARIAES
jgi:hypothetical protein